MAGRSRKIRVFVSSPSDVAEERRRVRHIVDGLNRTVCERLNLDIRLLSWDTDVTPGLGRAQSLINELLPGVDIFIGVMWKRFGTPTGQASSGTEEEFEIAHALWSHRAHPYVLFYFSQAPYCLSSTAEAEQLLRVLTFKSTLQQKGLICEYDSLDSFERHLREHLTNIIFKIAEDRESGKTIHLLTFDLDVRAGFAADKYGVIRAISRHIRPHLGHATSAAESLMLRRERSGSTGAGLGVAIPHMYGTGLPHHVLAIATSDTPINWQAVDDQPVDIVAAAFYGIERGDESLGVLTAISRALLAFRRRRVPAPGYRPSSQEWEASLRRELLGTNTAADVVISECHKLDSLILEVEIPDESKNA